MGKIAVHIHSGDCAAISARRAIPGTHLVYADFLMDGPVPVAFGDGWGMARGLALSPSVGYTPAQVAARLNRQAREIVAEAGRADEVFLWFDHCLYDQLILHFVIACLLPTEAKSVHLVPCPADCLGFGELPDEVFPRQFTGAVRLSAAAIRDSRERIWPALMSDRASEIEALAESETPEFPDTPAAARRLLEQLPDSATGLDRLETEILQVLTKEGEMKFTSLFPTLQKMEAYPFFGDDYIRNALKRMSDGTHPLVAANEYTFEALPDAVRALRGEFRWSHPRNVANLPDIPDEPTDPTLTL